MLTLRGSPGQSPPSPVTAGLCAPRHVPGPVPGRTKSSTEWHGCPLVSSKHTSVNEQTDTQTMCCSLMGEKSRARSTAGLQRKEAMGSTHWEGGKARKWDSQNPLGDAHLNHRTIQDLAPSTSAQPSQGRKDPFEIFSLHFLFLGQQGEKRNGPSHHQPLPRLKGDMRPREPRGGWKDHSASHPSCPLPFRSEMHAASWGSGHPPPPPPQDHTQSVKSPF